ncbi:hypothetical protein DRP53_09755 [candidate division WOR-3 bacterium]|uniref:Uncharacterized protein n=1 Tax=candidate division WOR-3 bacterium TaxID=2052148 RepID=A0A660SDK8_UNCW3|nr:MAG: hypothetical protein DRP53_09755 [candidate division WOR-3 bacterium]
MAQMVTIPKEVVISMLKALPERVLLDIFWKVLVAYDTSPLTPGEKRVIRKAKADLKQGNTIRWEDIR